MLNVQSVVKGYNSFRSHWSTVVGDEFELEVEELNRHYKLQPHAHTATQQLPNKIYVKMIVTHRYSPPKRWYHTLVLTSEYIITLQTSTSYVHVHVYAIAFCAGLHINTLQVDQVNREKDNQTFTYTQLVPSNSLQPVTHTYRKAILFRGLYNSRINGKIRFRKKYFRENCFKR